MKNILLVIGLLIAAPLALTQDQDVFATPSMILGEKRGGTLLAVAPPDISGIEPVVREHLRLARENLA